MVKRAQLLGVGLDLARCRAGGMPRLARGPPAGGQGGSVPSKFLTICRERSGVKWSVAWLERVDVWGYMHIYIAGGGSNKAGVPDFAAAPESGAKVGGPRGRLVVPGKGLRRGSEGGPKGLVRIGSLALSFDLYIRLYRVACCPWLVLFTPTRARLYAGAGKCAVLRQRKSFLGGF